MRKWLMMTATVLFTVSAAGLTQASLTFDDAIKKVMQEAMKGGLCKTVVEGKATADEKKELLEMFKSLCEATPPEGDEESWKEKTEALVKAAEAVVEGKADGTDMLKKAADCKACHNVHKGG